MSAAVIPPAPPPPIYTRGEHHSRIHWGLLLGIFGLVLAVTIGAAALVVKSKEPAPPKPVCPTLPCGKPPTPPRSRAAAFVPGTPFTSQRFGYRFDYDPSLWTVSAQDESNVQLGIGGKVVLTIQGFDPSEGTPEELMNHRIATLPFNVVSLSEDTKEADRILGPAVGYESGVGKLLQGALDTPQGPGSPIDVVVMAATDGKVTVVMTLVTFDDVKDQAFGLADQLMNEFRFPSEVAS